MGSKPLVMVEAGVRIPAPSLGVLLLLPPLPAVGRAPHPAASRSSPRIAGAAVRRARLVEIGRLLLEGG